MLSESIFRADRALDVLRSRRLRIWAVLLLGAIALIVARAWLAPQHGLDTGPEPLAAVTLLVVFSVAIVCEFVDSTLGMGYGTTLTPLLLLAGFEPLAIVPCVLLSEFATGLAAAGLHHRDGNVDFLRDRRARSTALVLGSLSTVGTVAAVTLAVRVPKVWLTGMIAVLILSAGVTILVAARHRFRYRYRHIVAVGALAAFNKGLSGGGYGPLVTAGQVVSGVNAKHAVAITSLAESLTCLVGLIAYLVMQPSIDWALAMPLTLGALLSVPLATLTVRKLPESVMRTAVGGTTCLLGLLALSKVIF